MIKSPIRWVGGKSKSAKKLLELYPQHYTCIVPFCGGLHDFLNKPKSKVEVINDINGELINFYMTIVSNYKEFKDKFNYLIPSRELFNQWKINDNSLSNMDRAIRFFYINRTCFSGDMQRPRFGTSNIRRNNLCCITDSFDNFINPIHNRLKDVTIENLDFKEIFKRYSMKPSTKEKREIFFLIDPPYKETYGYENEFSQENHKELSDILHNLDGKYNKFLLTINNNKDILEWYKDFYIIENDVCYKICKDIKGIGNRKELIITNYDINKITTKN